MNATLPVVPTPIPAMTDLVFAVTLALLLMAPLAIAGVALINTGLGRSRSAAQALLGNPRLIIVDEPTAGLDPEERVRFHNLLSAIGGDATGAAV